MALAMRDELPKPRRTRTYSPLWLLLLAAAFFAFVFLVGFPTTSG